MSDLAAKHHEEALNLIPRKEYRPLMLKAAHRLPCLDDSPNDLYQMLFSEEDLEWLHSQKRAT